MKVASEESKDVASSLSSLNNYLASRGLLALFGKRLATFERAAGMLAKVRCLMTGLQTSSGNDEDVKKSVPALSAALKGTSSADMEQIFNKDLSRVSSLLELSLKQVAEECDVSKLDPRSEQYQIVDSIANMEGLAEHVVALADGRSLRGALEAATTVAGMSRKEDLSFEEACTRLVEVKKLAVGSGRLDTDVMPGYEGHCKALLATDAVLQITEVIATALESRVKAVTEILASGILRTKIDFCDKGIVEKVIFMKPSHCWTRWKGLRNSLTPMRCCAKSSSFATCSRWCRLWLHMHVNPA